MTTAEATLVDQDPDSLEDVAQEPGEPEGVEPAESAAEPEEVPAAEVEADAAGQADDAGTATDGRPRDEKGRFTSAQGAPSESAPPIADTSPPAEEPFSFRVDGLSVEVEGAKLVNGEIRMPREAWDRHVQNRVADRGRIQRNEERMQGRIRELERESEAREERFRTVLGKVDQLFGDPERIKAFVQQYQTEAPRFKLEIENELLKSQTKRHTESVQQSAREAEEREFNETAIPKLREAVDVVLDRLAKGQKLDRKAIAAEIEAQHEDGVPFFFEVKEGDGSGLDPREFKWGINLKRVERLVGPLIKLHARQEAENKAKQVEQANNAKLGLTPKPKAPPVAPASGSPAPGGKEQYPTNREEYEAYKKRRAAELNLPM
jgi:hypothetical protein